MVGRLNLQSVSDDDLFDMNFKTERVLDSPDSGLPPSPSPSPWLVPVGSDRGSGSLCTEDEDKGAVAASIKRRCRHGQRAPLSYGEGIELDPLPAKEIRYTSSVRYDSERHFIHDISMEPRGHGLDQCSQTVFALPNCTWRRYKTELELQPRQRVQSYQSTTIVYPKHARTIYTTQLNYDGKRLSRRFLSSVELEASDSRPSRVTQ